MAAQTPAELERARTAGYNRDMDAAYRRIDGLKGVLRTLTTVRVAVEAELLKAQDVALQMPIPTVERRKTQ